jgi:hypothetical protein
MTANVRISGPVRTEALRVPVEAVLLKEGKPVVYKLSGSGPPEMANNLFGSAHPWGRPSRSTVSGFSS